MTLYQKIGISLLTGFFLVCLAACEPEQRYAPLPPGSVVLAFGDSVTYGTGANKGEDFPTLLAQQTGWKVINAGISGDTAGRAKSRIASLLQQHEPDMVLVELGGNDFLRQRSPGLVKTDLREILERVMSSGAVPVLIAVPRVSMVRASLGVLADSPIYAELASEKGVALIDEVFAQIVSDSSLRADRIHPNAEGYRQFTERLLDKLAALGISP
jgi:acyl-CoA thioesterase-1